MKKQILIALIKRYRQFLYLCHRQPSVGLMHRGIPCLVEDPYANITHDDIVHPCVRYIEEGFEGHQWWMVYTPLYGGDDHMENPRLCYADSNNDMPPTRWKYYCIIKNQPESGYNSDPSLLYYRGELYVFWRECHTEATKKAGYDYATFGCIVHNGATTPLPEVLLLNVTSEDERTHDREVSPNFWSHNNKLKAFAMHQKFDPNFVFHIPFNLGRFLYRYRIFELSDALGLYNKIKNIGIAIWEGDSLYKQFKYIDTTKIKNVSRLYQPWHMDIFQNAEEDTTLYAIIQTSQHFADICLGRCDDGLQFRLFKKPLLTSRSIGLSGIYKSTALIVGDNLYLYYTARDNQDLKLNKLFVTTAKWSEILHSIQ